MRIKTEKGCYTFFSNLGILINSELEEEIKKELIPNEINEKEIIDRLRRELTDIEIEYELGTVRNLTLNITEACNFRCGYCAFSGIYENRRVHNNKKMDLNTAKKAIDYFFLLLMTKKRKVKINRISISFYGGEPLLEFSLLKQIISYALEKSNETGIKKIYELDFRISTNGSLLGEKDIILYLTDNNISIDLSLDGPEGEHDKFRRTINNNNTWQMIWKNINHIYNFNPKYYKEKISFLVTLHPFHDFQAIDDYFLKKPGFFDIERIMINFVNKFSLSSDLLDTWFKNVQYQRSILAEKKFKKQFESKFSFNQIEAESKFTSMCFPGAIKIFVNTDGKFNICERVKDEIIIGDVERGYDFDVIRNIQRNWNEEIIKNRCWECNARIFCNVCIAQAEDTNGRGKFRLVCTYKDKFRERLYKYILSKENEIANIISNKELPDDNIIDYIKRI